MALPNLGSELERSLITQCRFLKLPEPEREYVFHPVRKWRFDLIWRDQKLAVEIDGGQWNGGRHGRGAGMNSDCEKQAEAVLAGWRVLRFTGDMVESGRAAFYIERALGRA